MGNPRLESSHYLSKLACYRLTEHLRGVENMNGTFNSRGCNFVAGSRYAGKGKKVTTVYNLFP